MTVGKKSFTMLELLVVIAIITILASILLPVLHKARKKGRYARWLCYKNNLRCDSNLVAYYDFQERDGTGLNNEAVGSYGDTIYRPEKMKGAIDEIAVYDRALTANEIKNHYEMGRP